MKFAELDDSAGHLIELYGPEGVAVGGRRYVSSLIVTPEHIIEQWGPSQVAGLTVEHLQVLVSLSPQVILLGTGDRQVFPDPEIYHPVMQAGIGIEIMDTGAACRTYNILMSEGRRVAAGLILDLV